MVCIFAISDGNQGWMSLSILRVGKSPSVRIATYKHQLLSRWVALFCNTSF